MPRAKLKKKSVPRKTTKSSKKSTIVKAKSAKTKIPKKNSILLKIIRNLPAIVLLIFLLAFIFLKVSASFTGNAIFIPEGALVDSDNPELKGGVEEDSLGEYYLPGESLPDEGTPLGNTGISIDKPQIKIQDSKKVAEEFGKSYDSFVEQAILPWWNVLFGETSTSVFLSKLMFVLLMFVGCWYVSGQVDEIKKSWIMHTLLTIILGILFTRWIGEDTIVKNVLMPYTAVGAGLSTLLPIGIAFYILVLKMQGKRNALMRILGWIFIFCYLGVSWWIGYKTIEVNREYLVVYPIAMALVLILAAFSKTIQVSLRIASIGTDLDFEKELRIQEINRQMRIATENMTHAKSEESRIAAKEVLKGLEEQVKEILSSK
ncbi:MAG TPA: hypothetical protein PLK34_01285 [Candidatus Pacearchaeota archaeon]|nr:hypothetical protein [Candidatus Pacearchaeota archaeon]